MDNKAIFIVSSLFSISLIIIGIAMIHRDGVYADKESTCKHFSRTMEDFKYCMGENYGQ